MLTQLNQQLNIIQSLDDEPNDVGGLSADELKEKFDEAGNIIKEYLNTVLIPDLENQLDLIWANLEALGGGSLEFMEGADW